MQKYDARVLVNENATDGSFSKSKLAEYCKLGAQIMVNIEGTDIATEEDDLPLDLDIQADRIRLFGKDIF